MTTTNPTMDISLRAAVAAERDEHDEVADVLQQNMPRWATIDAAEERYNAAKAATDAAVTRAEAIEAALRECLRDITAGGPQDYFDAQMYDMLINATDVERWRAALGEVGNG